VDLSYTPEDEAYRRKVREWFERNRPGPLDSQEQRRAWHRQLYEAGFIGMGWPKEYGGQSARAMEQAIVGEEMARLNVPGGVNGLGIGFIGPTLIVHGTEEQKRRYIPKILNAEEIWCQLYSEPNAGSDLAGLRTNAVRESFEDGVNYVVYGQ
jgi:alkylation response protein AidB-like acyl-CoA dehydrogenase